MMQQFESVFGQQAKPTLLLFIISVLLPSSVLLLYLGHSKDIHLVYQYYKSSNSSRQQEIDTALLKNIENEYIHQIHLLLEGPQSLPPPNLMNSAHERIAVTYLNQPLSFDIAFQYAQDKLAGKFVIFANADIYFDKTIRQLQRQLVNLNNKGLVLSTWDQYNKDLYSRCNKYQSFDTYIFEPPFPHFSEILPSVKLPFGGVTGIENRIIWELHNITGMNFENPCNLIITHHLHASGVRVRTNGTDLSEGGKFGRAKYVRSLLPETLDWWV